jgi:hypothetical protein
LPLFTIRCTLLGDEALYFVEYLESKRAIGAPDLDDLDWHRYRPGFDSEGRAAIEALWLSVDDDGRFLYRVVPE